MNPEEFSREKLDEARPLRRSTGGHLREARERWHQLPLPLRILGYIFLALFTVWLILLITKGRFLKHPVERIATSMLQRDVKVGGDFQLYFAPIQIKFLAEDLTVANPAWAGKGPFFAAKLIDARIATFRLIFGDRVLNRLLLDGSRLDLRWTPDGLRNTWTFGDPNRKGEPFDLPQIRRAALRGTEIHYADPRLFLFADIKVNTVDAKDSRFQEAIGFTGNGRLRDGPFTLRGSLLSPNETVAGGRNQLTLAADAGRTHMDVSGTLAGPTQLEGADLSLGVRGPNLARLFDFLGVAVPDTRSYRMRSALTYEGKAWKFTRMKGVYGASDLAGSMTISMPNERLLIESTLTTDRLHMIDIAPFVGYDPNRIEAKGAAGLVEQVNGTPRILPDAPLRVDAIRRFDAKIGYKVREIVGKDIPISNVAMTLILDKGLLKLAPIDFLMAGGAFSSDIAINARSATVVTDYDIRLSPTPMGKLLSRWGVEESGTTGTIKARVQMRGEGDTVRKSLATSDGRIAVILPKGTMWARNIQLAEIDIGTFIQKMFEKKLKEPVEINCGLIAFSVRDGIASADPILIDTKKNVILGRGAFSFKDESLDVAMRADGKTFSLFSGQSPVGIDGYFAAPGINPISPELVGRAGIGVGLGAALSPLAAVIAFVDVGDAKAAACGPVLSGASAKAQRTAKGKPRDDVGRGTPSKQENGR